MFAARRRRRRCCRFVVVEPSAHCFGTPGPPGASASSDRQTHERISVRFPIVVAVAAFFPSVTFVPFIRLARLVFVVVVVFVLFCFSRDICRG